MRCASCGREAVAGERFCQGCGKPLSPETAQTGAAPAPPPSSAAPQAGRPRVETAGQAPISPWQNMAWAALAIALYLVIADGALEAVAHQVPGRWWIAAGAGLYFAICLALWHFVPQLWRRGGWAPRATASAILVLGTLTASMLSSGDTFAGLTVFTASMSTVLVVTSALAIVAAVGILLRSDLPIAARAIGALLGAYGIVACVLAAKAGTPYPALFHGGGQWSRAPVWLQGTVVGTLFVVPVALIVGVIDRILHRAKSQSSGFSFGVAALALSVVMAVVGWRAATGTNGDGTQLADASSGGNGSSATSGDAIPADQSGYDDASDKLNRVMGALDVLDNKMDHSLFDIDALAAKLGSDPTVIFHFVRDQIRYEPYVGVLRGALGTLVCRSGNSVDRSLLLATLLQKAGLSVQISSGQLSATDARSLALRVFEPAPRAPSAIPQLTDLAPDLSQAMGVEQQKLQQVAVADSVRGAVEEGRLLAYVDSESASLADLLKNAGVEAGTLGAMDRLAAEARLHYWVRYQNSAGQWIDLDPSFADAEPGKARTRAASSVAPDALPEELYHHLRVTLAIRVASSTKSGDQTDQVLLDQELRVPDLQGKAVTISTQPATSVDPSRPGVTLKDVLSAARTYQTALLVGDQVTPGKGFDMSGQIVGGVATPEGADVQQAGGIGGANGGLLGGIAGASGGDSAAPQTADSRIVGTWVDYKLTSPGVQGAAPEVRTYHRDIIAPVTVKSWGPGNPGKPETAPTSLSVDALRDRLMWSAQLLAVTGTPIPGYAGYLELERFRAARPVLDALLKAAHGLPSDVQSMQPPTTENIGSLLLANSGMYLERHGGAPSLLHSYFARPGLIAYEAAPAGSDHGLWEKEGYDVVSYAPRIVANPSANPASLGPQVTLLALRRGVLTGRLELMLMTSHDSVMAAGGTTINATKVFAAADTRNTRLLVLRPGHGNAQDVAAVSAPDSVRAELWSDLALGQTLIVPARQVAVDGRPQIGWWRLDGASGELIAVMPGERGQGAAEYVTMAVNTLSYFQCITGIPREDSNGIKWGKWAVCTGGFVMGTYGVFVFEEDNLWGGILEIMGQGLMWGAQ